MPNWCNNSITISGPTETIKQLWEDAQTAHVYKDRDGNEERGFGLLSAIAPLPEILRGTTSPTPDNIDSVWQSTMLAQTGYDNWYDWQVNTWGTKWDVSDEGLEYIEDGDTATITGWFDSAWAPPIGAYDMFCDDMDNCSLSASYHEPGMDFAGFYEDGEDQYMEGLADECELPEDERSDLFNRIDEEYGIVESYEMWKQEEEETV